MQGFGKSASLEKKKKREAPDQDYDPESRPWTCTQDLAKCGKRRLSWRVKSEKIREKQTYLHCGHYRYPV